MRNKKNAIKVDPTAPVEAYHSIECGQPEDTFNANTARQFCGLAEKEDQIFDSIMDKIRQAAGIEMTGIRINLSRYKSVVKVATQYRDTNPTHYITPSPMLARLAERLNSLGFKFKFYSDDVEVVFWSNVTSATPLTEGELFIDIQWN